MFVIGIFMQAFINTLVVNEFPAHSSLITKMISYCALAFYLLTALKNPGLYRKNMIVFDSQGHKKFAPH